MLIFRSSFQFPIKRFAPLASQLQISVMNGDLLATVTVGVFRSGSGSGLGTLNGPLGVNE